jgi:hypothetical protein
MVSRREMFSMLQPTKIFLDLVNSAAPTENFE